MEWYEFQLWYGGKLTKENLYSFRKLLLPILDKYKIEDFLVLNEPEFVLLRVPVSEETMKDIEKDFEDLIEQSGNAFSKLTIAEWDSEKDARDRILGAAQRLGLKLEEGKGWMIAGREPLNQHWIPTLDDLDLKTKEFSIFMKKVVGRFTRAYIEQMPRRIDDRWLLSVMIHLILNSILIDTIQESETRAFPYV